MGKSFQRCINKIIFPKIADRLTLRINATPNFTVVVTGHGNIKTYLYKPNVLL